MPTVKIEGPYRFFFYSNEADEPAHIHVDRDDRSAKFWLDPVSLVKSIRFSPVELNGLLKLVQKHRAEFLGAWREHFGG
jgi:hypothetical protein